MLNLIPIVGALALLGNHFRICLIMPFLWLGYVVGYDVSILFLVGIPRSLVRPWDMESVCGHNADIVPAW